MTLPLQGILVVSLEQAVAAPMCSCRLADAGARVIKIERPEGDFARGYDALANGQSTYFVWLNRGKESLVLDLTKQDDKALLEAMLAKADVFIQNLKPGAVAKLGFAVERLRKDYPRLIVCSVSGYGDTGPYAERKAYDMLIQAEAGLASVTGGPEAPARVGVSVCDIGSGMNAYEAILEALIQRGRTGEGAAISVSMFDAIADWMTTPLLQHEGGVPPKRIGLAHTSIAPYGVFKSKDGADILISIQSDREWRVLAEKVMGDKALAADPNFATNIERVKRRADTDGKVGGGVRRARCRCAGEEARSGRYRVRPGQRAGGAGAASASAPHRCRLAERAAVLSGAGGAMGRRAAEIRPGAGGRRAQREDQEGIRSASPSRGRVRPCRRPAWPAQSR